MARTMGRDSSVVDESVPRGTTRRVLSYARPYRGTIAVFLVIVTLAALTSVAAPLALKTVVDDGVIPGDRRVVVLDGPLDDALAALLAHGWPGNVRELENIIHRSVLMAQGNQIDAMAVMLPASARLSSRPASMTFSSWEGARRKPSRARSMLTVMMCAS